VQDEHCVIDISVQMLLTWSLVPAQVGALQQQAGNMFRAGCRPLHKQAHLTQQITDS
jgi:hypothetical protein